MATLTIADARFPGAVTLRPFSPLIPLNDRDSSLPAAFFEYTLTTQTQLIRHSRDFFLSRP